MGYSRALQCPLKVDSWSKACHQSAEHRCGLCSLSGRKKPFSGGVAAWSSYKGRMLIFDPQSEGMRRWNRYFLLSSALGTAVDPLFLSVFSINARLSCLYVQKGNLIALTTVRALIDCGYLTQIWLQLRTAYVSKESLVLGRGELIWDAQKIATNYITALSGFAFDVYIILPVPQVMLWVITPRLIAKGGDTTRVMSFILISFMVQYLPKLVHSALLIRRLQRVTGYVFGTAASGFFLNLITYFICGGLVLVPAHSAASGSMSRSAMQVRGALRVHSVRLPGAHCLPRRNVGPHSPGVGSKRDGARLLNRHRRRLPVRHLPVRRAARDGRPLHPENSLSPVLGLHDFQDCSSFGNALTPSDHIYEVLFSIIVVTCGLLLFTLLIGNIQVFLQSMTAKKSQMELRIRDLEWWMRRRQLPSPLRLRVRQQERHRWAATRGIDEEALVEDLPEGLRRDIKRHLCLDLLHKVPLFHHFDDLILHNICDRLKPLLFSKNESVINEGSPIRQMIFVVRGSLRCEYRHLHNKQQTSSCVLGPGDFFGDELITWGLCTPGGRLPSSRATLTTVVMTEAVALQAKDVQYITEHFRDIVSSSKLKRITRYYSTTWRVWAAITIQLAWRHYQCTMPRQSHH